MMEGWLCNSSDALHPSTSCIGADLVRCRASHLSRLDGLSALVSIKSNREAEICGTAVDACFGIIENDRHEYVKNTVQRHTPAW